MPGRFFLKTPMPTIAEWIGQEVGGLTHEPARGNIQPGQNVVCLAQDGFAKMRWGIIPVGRVNARGRPVMETIINARSETLFGKSAFDGLARAVVIVDGWYEWTGKARQKTVWRIFGEAPLIFAAITDVWTAPNGLQVSQVATVTCEPNVEIARIHHRMGFLLRPKDIALWLTGSETEVTPLMVPWLEGQLTIEAADDVDWSAP